MSGMYSKRRYVRKAAVPKGLARVSAAQVDRNLASEVAKLKRIVRKRAPELKYFDTSLSFVNVADTVGAVNHITSMGQGTAESQRVSDVITVSAIDCLVRVGTTSGSTGTSPNGDEAVRFALVQDTQQVSDTVPTVGVIMAQTTNPHNPLKQIETGITRFKILWMSPVIQTARITASSTPVATLTSLSPTQPNWAFAHVKCNVKVRFNGNSGTDIEKNGLYVICWTNVAADTVDADGFTRITYTDM